jgi:hypothetical protein
MHCFWLVTRGVSVVKGTADLWLCSQGRFWCHTCSYWCCVAYPCSSWRLLWVSLPVRAASRSSRFAPFSKVIVLHCRVSTALQFDVQKCSLGYDTVTDRESFRHLHTSLILMLICCRHRNKPLLPTTHTESASSNFPG